MTKQYKLKGLNDDHDTCEICGKTNLKRVMWLVEINEDEEEIGEAFAAGTTCGAKKLGLKQRSEVKISQKLQEIAKNQVNTKIDDIFDGFVKYNSYLISPELISEVRNGSLSPAETILEREKTYPILGYLNGRMTLEEAVRYT